MTDSQLLIIGDVHGCFHTFRELMQLHWRPQEEVLVQLGDIIDRGNYTPECVAVARTLQSRFADRVVFLKGNHEFEAALFHETRSNPGWLSQGGSGTLAQYKESGRNLGEDVAWMKSLPLLYETSRVLITHAGVTETKDPYRESNSRGVLWNRTPLKNLGKLQVIGHTPLKGKPEFRPDENAWNVDTGAYKGNALSAIRVSAKGEIMDIISLPTVNKDYIVNA